MKLQKNLQKFKQWTIIGLFSDDEFFEKFVLKGGSALELYDINSRSSIDIDVAMKDDFRSDELLEIKKRLNKAIADSFNEHGYIIFDFKFEPRPMHQDKVRESYWGGYLVEFKIYRTEKFKTLDIDKARNSAEEIDNHTHSRKFTIDISKFEFFYKKEKKNIDGNEICIYSLDMIIYEKLRALCQQLPQYFINRGNFKKARTKDFYDIYTIMKKHKIKFSNLSMDILKGCFKAKKVDFKLLMYIQNFHDRYLDALPSLKDTLISKEQDEFNFDECYQFVIDGINQLLKQNDKK